MTVCASFCRAGRALLALVLATGWLLTGVLTAGADEADDAPDPTSSGDDNGRVQVQIVHPAQGATTTVAVDVEARVSGAVRRPAVKVEVAGRRGDLQCSDDGIGSWTCAGTVGLSGVDGGDYPLVVTATSEGGETGRAERGIHVPPVTAEMTGARVVDAGARAIEVTWVRSEVWDFDHYVIERKPPGGSWHNQHITTNQAQTRHVDTVPSNGDYQYRLTVWGHDRFATSGPVRVSLEDQSAETDDDTNTSTRPSARSGASDAPSLTTQLRRGDGDGQSSAQAPRTAPREPGLDMFEPELDYGEVPEVSARDVTEREVTLQDSATEEGQLTVSDRDFQAEQVLVPVAGGLVFTLGGLHVRRFLSA